jgi:hypothetical protein
MMDRIFQRGGFFFSIAECGIQLFSCSASGISDLRCHACAILLEASGCVRHDCSPFRGNLAVNNLPTVVDFLFATAGPKCEAMPNLALVAEGTRPSHLAASLSLMRLALKITEAGIIYCVSERNRRVLGLSDALLNKRSASYRHVLLQNGVE